MAISSLRAPPCRRICRMAQSYLLLPLAASLVATTVATATHTPSKQEQIWDIPPDWVDSSPSPSPSPSPSSLSSSKSSKQSPSNGPSPSPGQDQDQSQSQSQSQGQSQGQARAHQNHHEAKAKSSPPPAKPHTCPPLGADHTRLTMREDFVFSFLNVFIVKTPDDIVGAVAWNPFSTSLEVRLFTSSSDLWAVARVSYRTGEISVLDCADRPVAKLLPGEDGWNIFKRPKKYLIFDATGDHKRGHAEVKVGDGGHRTMRFYDQEEFLVSKILQWSAGTVVSAEIEVFEPSQGSSLLLSDVRVLALISALHLGNFVGLAFGPAVGLLVGLMLLCCLRSVCRGTTSAVSRCFNEDYSYEHVDPQADRQSKRGLPNLFVKRDEKRPLRRLDLGDDGSAEADSAPSWLQRRLFGARVGGAAARTYSRNGNGSSNGNGNNSNSNSSNNNSNNSHESDGRGSDGEGKLDSNDAPDPFGACLCQIQLQRLHALQQRPSQLVTDRLASGDILGAGRQIGQALAETFHHYRGGRQLNDFQRMESFTEVDGDADVLLVSEAYSAQA